MLFLNLLELRQEILILDALTNRERRLAFLVVLVEELLWQLCNQEGDDLGRGAIASAEMERVVGR